SRKSIRLSDDNEVLNCSYFKTDLDIIKILPYVFDNVWAEYTINSAEQIIELRLNEKNDISLYLYCLKNLQVLTIVSSNLIHVPIEIRNLKQLIRLTLYYNYDLVSVPDEIGELKSLIQLNIYASPKLLSLPHGFKQLSNIEQMSITYCGFKQIPKAITGLIGLRSLDLRYNKITSIPYEMKRLRSLTDLNLSGNLFKSLDGFTRLKNHSRPIDQINSTVNPQDISTDTRFTTLLPYKLTLLNSLSRLDMSNNPHLTDLTGVGIFQNLKFLQVWNSSIREIPKDIVKLSSTLEFLNLNDNQLTDVPQELTQMSKLETLYVRDNRFSNETLVKIKLMFKGTNITVAC
ncbi:unnamed protein product, partial [Didymodactylos carnosus]